jgi:drug/metabolite transporter (DMT)-like permease
MIITTERSSLARDLALLLLLSALWGASYSFVKIGVETIPPVTLIAARTIVAGALLFAIARGQGLRLPADLAAWRRFCFQACLNSVIPFTLIAWAEQTTEASLATILNSTSPIFVFLLTALVTRHEPITAQKVFGVCAGLVGICLVVGVQALGGLGKEFGAQIAIVVSAVCYAGAAIFGRNFKTFAPIIPATGSMICGAAILVPISLVIDHPWTLTPSLQSMLAALALAIFSTALGFVLYFRLLATLGSIGVTTQAYLRVPFGVAIGVLFLGETVTPTMLLGLVFVVIGVAAMAIPPRKTAPVRSTVEASGEPLL